MRLPTWLHHRRTRRTTPRTVTVDLTIDTAAFEDGMRQVAEDLADARYHRRLAYERQLGHAQVGALLDGMCRDLGLDPVQAWRLPRSRERRHRRDLASFAAATRAAVDLEASLQRAGRAFENPA